MDAFLNSYCANVTHTTTFTRPTVTETVTQVRITTTTAYSTTTITIRRPSAPTVTETVTTTTTTTAYSTTTVTSISCSIATDVPMMYTSTVLSNNRNNAVVHSKQRVTVTLGAVLGLLSLLLLIVATGWVWTCWIMKKRAMLEQAR